MSTHKSFVEFVIDQIKDQGKVRSRRMFGDYCIYYDNKVVALCCDDKLFIKPTKAGKDFILSQNNKEDFTPSPPFEGAKDWYLIQDKIEDSDYINELITITSNELPEVNIKMKNKNEK